MIDIQKFMKKVTEKIGLFSDKFNGSSGISEMFVVERCYSPQQDLAADKYLANTIDITKSGYIPIAVQGVLTENNGGSNCTAILLRGYLIVDNELTIYVRNVYTKAANFRHYADILYVKG